MRNDAISLISRKLGISKEEFHQNYETIGRAMIIREEDEFDKDETHFWRLILSSFRLWAVYKYTGIYGTRRVPSVKMVSGIHTLVTQREDGILYIMDPQKIMFSKGNKNERHRLAGEVSSGETVLDMFGGIGYFSIPLSFKVKKIYSCDINPDSFHYLVLNKRLNGATNLIPILGDSAKLPMKNFADRVIMGHFDSHRYLSEAMRYLKREGKIHLHQLVKRDQYATVLLKYRKHKFVNSAMIRKVKSYSPSHDHVALDLEVIKN